MSSFSSISALAGLGQAAGQGEAFLNRFAQGQELVSQGLRRQQINAQIQQAEMDRELRLREIAAQQQSRAFSDILEAQSQERAASRQSRMDALREKEAELDLADREQRINERFQRQQAISQLPEEVQQLAAAGMTGAAGQVMASKEQGKDLDSQISKQSKGIRELQLVLSDPELPEDQREPLTAVLRQKLDAFRELQQRSLQNKEAIQSAQPVKKGDAGPNLRRALEDADQNAPLPPPRDEAGRVRMDRLKLHKVYQFDRGPGVNLGDGKVNIITEVPQVEEIQDPFAEPQIAQQAQQQPAQQPKRKKGIGDLMNSALSNVNRAGRGGLF